MQFKDRDPAFAYWRPNIDGAFSFVMSPDDPIFKASEISAEMIDRFAGLFEYAHGFLRADEVGVKIHVYSEDYDLGAGRMSSKDSEPVQYITKSVSGSDIRSEIEGAFESVEVGDSETKAIWKIKTTEVATRIWLPGCDEFLTAGHERFRADVDNSDEYPIADGAPLRVELSYRPYTSPPTFIMRFWRDCDVWLLDSKVGERNRERLGEVFDYLKSEYRIHDTLFPGPPYPVPDDTPELVGENYTNTEIEDS
jgi:hypothetical protein